MGVDQVIPGTLGQTGHEETRQKDLVQNPPITLENSPLDAGLGYVMDSLPLWGLILNGKIAIPHLKEALDKAVHLFPILKGRMHTSGKHLILTENPAVLDSYTLSKIPLRHI